ncbi:hypothetical protein AZZ62_002595, partial [Klebsiella variicola]
PRAGIRPPCLQPGGIYAPGDD